MRYNEITADRFIDHHEYYMQLADVMGIGWPDENQPFLGHGKDYWEKLYNEDRNLNNHPLKRFDACFPWHLNHARRLKIPWSMCDTVCCLKAVIIDKIKS